MFSAVHEMPVAKEHLVRGGGNQKYYNSVFYPQSVSVRFMWFSQQVAVVSLNSINRLVFVANT
jgi:hypothetical protein